MLFQFANGNVLLRDQSGDELILTVEQFWQLEPDATRPATDVVEVWEPEWHYIQDPHQRDGSHFGDRSTYLAKINQYRAALAPPSPPAPTLASAIALKLEINLTEADTRFNALVASYPTMEPHTWATKALEANTLPMGGLFNPDDFPALKAEAMAIAGLNSSSSSTAIKTAMSDRATVIRAKERSFKIGAGKISGVRSRVEAELFALTTVQAALAFDVAARWNVLMQ